MTCSGTPPLSAGLYDPFEISTRVLTKKIRVTDHGFLQLQHCRRTIPRCDPQEEAGGFRLSPFRHRGRRGAVRDRGIAGGFAERRLSAARRSPLRPERHPYAVREPGLSAAPPPPCAPARAPACSR